MRRLAVLALALGACSGDDGGGPPIDPTDVDGDGIPNEQDVCPNRQDPSQHDDDADGLGDECDNCPAAPNPDQADTSERLSSPPQFPDGVGDACDRRPSQADDELARFFPFADPAEADAFTGSGFTIAGDRATSTASASWHVKRSEQGDGLSLQTTITRLAWPLPDGQFELHTDGDGLASGFTCAIVHAGATDTLVLAEINGATTTRSLGNLTTSATLVMTLSRAFSQLPTGTAACFLSIDGGAELRIDLTTSDDSPFGSYGFRATDANVEMTSATIFTTPFACDTPFTGGARPHACP